MYAPYGANTVNSGNGDNNNDNEWIGVIELC